MLPEEEATRLVAAFGIAVALFWWANRLERRRIDQIMEQVRRELRDERQGEGEA